MGELPLYELRIDFDDDTGVDQISLVDKPAIEIDWQHFNKSKESFKVLNEDKRIIAGFAMIANQNIYRNDKSGEYNVFFSKDTITQIIQKFFKTKTTDATNIMHTELTADDTYIIESFQIDSDRGIVTPKGFTEQVDGSWFVSMKVDSDKVWEEVKGGVYKGFSVEGIFDHVRQEFAGFDPKQKRGADGRWGDDDSITEDENTDASYRGSHYIDLEYSDPLNNLLEGDSVPEDFYENIHYYARGKEGKESMKAILDARGNPEKYIKIYRGVPQRVSNINNGDWVSLSRSYAELHADGREDWKTQKPYKVIEKLVKVKDVRWDANDINEMAYFKTTKEEKLAEKENNNEQMNNTEKTIFNKIKQLLSGSEAKEEEVVVTEEAIEVVFGEATLSDGTPIKWEGTLEVGTAIVVVTEEGDIPAPDGEHELADGTAIVKTEGGLVTEIMEMEAVVEEAEPVEEVADLTEVMTELMKEVGEKFNAYEIQLAEIKKDLDAKNEKIVELSKQEIATPVQKVAKTPKWKKFN